MAYIDSAKRSDWLSGEDQNRWAQYILGHVDLDPGANPAQIVEADRKCYGTGKRGDAHDGMAQDWHAVGQGRVYLNPDWGENPPKEGASPCWYPLSQWMRKLLEESRAGASILFVGPMSSGSKWFHEIVGDHAAAFCIHKGRIKFRLPEQPPDVPSRPGRDNLSALWTTDAAMVQRFRRQLEPHGMVIS